MTSPMTREEWMRRYASRVMERAGVEEHQAIYIATVAAEAEEEMDEVDHDMVWEDPEESADVELSYWDDDGDD